MAEVRWKVKKDVYCRHSDAYRWLRIRHDDIDRFLTERCGTFSYVVAEMAKDGVKGTKGQVLGYWTAVHLWQRVRRDVAKKVLPVALAPPPPPMPQASPLTVMAPTEQALGISASRPETPRENTPDPPVFGPLTIHPENLPTRRKRRRLTDEEFRVKIDRVRQDFRDDDKFLHGF